jgi:hypothetical protein
LPVCSADARTRRMVALRSAICSGTSKCVVAREFASAGRVGRTRFLTGTEPGGARSRAVIAGETGPRLPSNRCGDYISALRAAGARSLSFDAVKRGMTS